MEEEKSGKVLNRRKDKLIRQLGIPGEGVEEPDLQTDRVAALRKDYVSLFICILSSETSKVELQSMLWRAGKIRGTFIPVDRRTGKIRGIGFVRFKTIQEALRAIVLVDCRSWGGRKISVTLTRPQAQMNRRRPLVPPHHPPARRKPAWTSGDGAALRDTWWGIGGPSLH